MAGLAYGKSEQFEYDFGPLVYDTKDLITNAINFAVLKHSDQVRKGTNIPYIMHPYEVMKILSENGCSEQVRAAGMLHDVLEDTKTSPAEIKDVFGEDILKIVEAESEDKSKPWKERKQATIDNLSDARYEVKMVCLADKLSNLRSMATDKAAFGEILWKRFNAPKNDIEWYYRQIFEKVVNLEHTKMLNEFASLLDDVFKE